MPQRATGAQMHAGAAMPPPITGARGMCNGGRAAGAPWRRGQVPSTGLTHHHTRAVVGWGEGREGGVPARNTALSCVAPAERMQTGPGVAGGCSGAPHSINGAPRTRRRWV